MSQRTAIVMLALTAVGSLFASRAAFSSGGELDNLTLIAPLGKDGLLVEARVIAVESTREQLADAKFHESFVGKLRISSVYCGRGDLLGVEFFAPTRKAPRSSISDFSVPPPLLEVGEIGLWTLREGRGGELVLGPKFMAGHVWPIRKGVNLNYNELAKLAQAIADIGNASTRSEQFQVTKKLVRDSSPAISVWAIEFLGSIESGKWTATETREFLEDLVKDPRLTVGAQVALDNALLNVRKEEWQNSSRRLQLLEKWVSSLLSVGDADLIFAQLGLLAQQPRHVGIEIEQLLRLIKTAVENERIPLESRVHALGIVSWMSLNQRRFENDEPAFEFLVYVVEHGKAQELRVAAAHRLGAFLATDTDHRQAVVVALKGTTKDEKLFKALGDALYPPKAKAKVPSKLLR